MGWESASGQDATCTCQGHGYQPVQGFGEYPCCSGRPSKRQLSGTIKFLIFIIGIFHLKMACADALWHIFIDLKTARIDANSLLQFVAQYQLQETRKNWFWSRLPPYARSSWLYWSCSAFGCLVGWSQEAKSWMDISQSLHSVVTNPRIYQGHHRLPRSQLCCWIRSQYFQIMWKSFRFLRCSAREHSHYAAIFFALWGDKFIYESWRHWPPWDC